MILNFGTRRVLTPVGRVADFCAFCRNFRPMSVQRAGKAVTWMGVPLGKGDLLEHVLVCDHCRTHLTVDPRRYAALETAPRVQTLRELADRTFPDLEQTWAHRLEQEARLRNGPGHLSDDERAVMLRQPFHLLAAQVERVHDSPPNDSTVALTFVAACVLPFLGIYAAIALEPRLGDRADTIGLWIGLGGLVLGILAVVLQQFRAADRHVLREVLPRIARALQPLEPTEGELVAAMATQPAFRDRLGHRRLGPAMIAAQLQADAAALTPSPAPRPGG